MNEIERDGAEADAEHETVRVSPLEVELDPYNPRLTLEEEGSGQAALLEIMIKRFKIEELAESILASGFNPFDPIVGWARDDRLTVLEGNRRVAAMQLLLEPQRAPAAYERRWTALSERLTPEVRATIEQIDVIVYQDRDAADVAAYIGFRHVTGVLKWPSLEKAKYIARLVEDHGWTYERIAERLGSYSRHVERHYVAYRLVRQVSEEEVPGAESMEGAFGVLLRALQAEGIAEFIGVEYPGDPERSRQPVPADRVETFATSSSGRSEPRIERAFFLTRADSPTSDRSFKHRRLSLIFDEPLTQASNGPSSGAAAKHARSQSRSSRRPIASRRLCRSSRSTPRTRRFRRASARRLDSSRRSCATSPRSPTTTASGATSVD